MQIQQTQKYQPNFQAYKLSTLIDGTKQIDIYSLTSKDTTIVDRMLNVVKGQHFSEDNKKLGAQTVRNIYDNALKKAKNINPYSKDRVLISVENNNKITGIMNISARGDMHVKGLAVWNNNKKTREGLVTTALKEIQNMTRDEYCLILPTKNSSQGLKQFFRKLGFKTPKDFGNKDLMVEGPNIQNALDKILEKFDGNIKFAAHKKNYDLIKTLKLDA